MWRESKAKGAPAHPRRQLIIEGGGAQDRGKREQDGGKVFVADLVDGIYESDRRVARRTSQNRENASGWCSYGSSNCRLSSGSKVPWPRW